MIKIFLEHVRILTQWYNTFLFIKKKNGTILSFYQVNATDQENNSVEGF